MKKKFVKFFLTIKNFTICFRIDACPNKNPFAPEPAVDDSIPSTTSISFDNDFPSRSISLDRRTTRNLQIRTLERNTRDKRDVRAALENRRLTRSMERNLADTRRDSRALTNERRSIEQRGPEISRLRSARIVRERTQAGRISGLVRRERANIRAGERRSMERREIRSLERTQDNRRDDRRNIRSNERSAAQRREIRSLERRERQTERVERVQDDRRDIRRTNIHSVDRQSTERREVRGVERQNRQAERIERTQSYRRDVRMSNNRANERTRMERRESRLSERTTSRLELSKVQPDVDRRQIARQDNRESRLSRFNEQKSRYGQHNRYLTYLPEFSHAKTNGSYELLKQALILAICAGYTASLFQRKTGFVRYVIIKLEK